MHLFNISLREEHDKREQEKATCLEDAPELCRNCKYLKANKSARTAECKILFLSPEDVRGCSYCEYKVEVVPVSKSKEDSL